MGNASNMAALDDADAAEGGNAAGRWRNGKVDDIGIDTVWLVVALDVGSMGIDAVL